MRTWLMCFVCVLFVLLSIPAQAVPDHAEVYYGDAVAGVDELGRVMIALETTPFDGIVDQFFLFTANDRLTPVWWEHLDDVTVVYKNKTLLLTTTPPDFVMSLAVDGAQAPHRGTPPGAEVFQVEGGVELAALRNGVDGVEGSVHDHIWADLESWPESFWYDTLDPASDCVQTSCQAGGEGSRSCGVECGPENACQTGCRAGYFACCNCPTFLRASCRCVRCNLKP